ncbi:RNA binding domain-containing protein [Paecilomyces variotii]|uniref:RNA binding domain-containing protein n=1 Tax=Byssochlamys spectabilis TaxID=264951 RepID=A0A443HWF8_BYSSP|nr:RNA binding domain-containing protein [Paecilomyces variotii]KAJ9357952.1 hypothetical protein DTO280E4_5380 [Paecilomyces variotii]RWQ96091.1 RNA binding domain-containing protein [Paecilomyces variotii]
MNAIRQVQALNKRELENAVPPEASWHADYRDTAYIYIGGLPYDLSEGDIITIFSQYGEPVHINLVRDKETGKSKGFAFLKYEDQRSTDLAVDNLGGATVMGRLLRVDHVRYKRREEEGDEDNVAKIMGDRVPAGRDDDTDDERRRKKRRTSDDEGERRRPLLKEERELQELIVNHDEEDPMKEFLIEEKKEEVARALEKLKSETKKSSRHRGDSRERSHRHRHRHRRRRSEDRSPGRERISHRDRSESRDRRSRRYRDESRTPELRFRRERSRTRSQSVDRRRRRDSRDDDR